MNRKKLFAGIVAASLIAAFAVVARSALSQQSAEELYQAALLKKEAEGDLNGAIQLFQRISTTHAQDRTIASKAQLQIGLCYEKLGSREARKAYEEVLSKYSDQSEVAAEARARLAALGEVPLAKEKAGPVLTELKLPAIHETHALSPNGTKVAYVAWSPGIERIGALMVRDLASGTDRQVTRLKEGMPLAPVWSPDGKSIAYAHWSQQQSPDGKGPASSHEEIWIASLDNAADRGTGVSGEPEDWSRDGRSILYMQAEGNRATLNLLPVAGGQPRTVFGAGLNELADRRFMGPGTANTSARLSPDGRFVTFARRNKQAFDIYLIPVEGGEPVPITDHPADDRNPIWTPDGKTLLFRSNRSIGQEGLWAQPIADGRPSGEPFLVKGEIGRTRLFSLSNNNRLLLARASGASHIYSVALDATTRQPAAPPVQLTRDGTGGSSPAWSPDGRRIAYIYGPDPARGPALRVMSADGGNDREIARVHGTFNDPLAWAPDNNHVYVMERDPDTGPGIYSISTSTGERKPVLLDDKLAGHLSCSPDGRQLAFVRMANRPQIFLADADGKNVRQITFDEATSAFYPTWSPDGKQIAFYKYVRSGEARMGLVTLTLEGGALAEVVGGSRGSSEVFNFWEPSWSPDGTHIVWAAPGPTSKPWGLPGAGPAPVLWLTKLANRKAEPFRVDLGPSETVSCFSPSWSPDGTKMLFYAETGTFQLLLMENFLPALKVGGKR